MRNYGKKETFTITRDARLETSNGVIPGTEKKDVEFEVTVAYDKDDSYGFFEIYDLETSGEDFYAEGGLWFEGRRLTDYDGIFELPDYVTAKLRQWGLDTSEIDY